MTQLYSNASDFSSSVGQLQVVGAEALTNRLAWSHNSDIERIQSALFVIPADDRDTWIKMGMAIKAEHGDAGFDIWNDWSQTSDSYKAKDAMDVWKSIKPDGGISIGSLFHEARAHGWNDNGTYQPPSAEELAERKRITEQRRIETEAQMAHEKAQAAEQAKAILKASTRARSDHPYLVRKQVSPTDTLFEIPADEAAKILGYRPQSSGEPLTGPLLIVPVKQGGSISTLELIDGTGRKAALRGRGTKAGGYWATEKLPDGDGENLRLLIGEGVATVLTASTATGLPGVAALSASNLQAVAEIMREKYPKAEITILADLVKVTGWPDAHAIDAATAVDGRVAIPNFGEDREPDLTDFNDMAVARGLDAVKFAIEGAIKPTRPEVKQEPAASLAREVSLACAADVAPEPIDWLWPGWLAAGKFHVFGGAPGTGKTTIAINLAATIATGGIWPDGTKAAPGNVVIWSGEDDPADTLVPRLALAGADLNRVFFVNNVIERGKAQPFDPARDMAALQSSLARIGDVHLLIVDPVVSAVAGDSHKNAEVRRGLQPLVDLARSIDCALLGITHFSKGTGGRDPTERITGSLAFGALARVVLVAAKHQDNGEDGETKRLFCRAKSNIGPDDGGFEYDLHQAELKNHPGVWSSAVAWGAGVQGTARDLLAVADATGEDADGGSLADAKEFLASVLADGPVPVKAIKADADGAGHSWATIRRAQKALGILAVKEGSPSSGSKQQWTWKMSKVLKKVEDAQHKKVSTFDKFEHLRDGDIIEVEI